jgi:competence/damage-inducible protein CinA-like protein
MKAVIIAIGDELISGKTVDTNSAYLADRLSLMGIDTEAHWTVGDDEEPIADALSAAARRADLVFVSGGLGPTQDDLTRQGLARAMGSELELEEGRLAEIEEFFRRRGREMIPENRVQAMIPVGATSLDNRMGTAPGIEAQIGDAKIFIMPGVPHEMRGMFESVITPRLIGSHRTILRRVVHTFGMGESDVGAQVRDLMSDRTGAVVVGTTVAAGMVSLRITVRTDGADVATELLSATCEEVRTRLGNLVVGEDDQTLPEVIGGLLRERQQTVATAESCTGGLIAQRLTEVAGASEYFLGSVVSYANSAKRDLLGVPPDVLESHGAVSAPVAEAMAQGARERTGADWAISATGIAGPGGGSEEKPVGLVYIGLSGPDGCAVHREVFPGTRAHIRLRTTLAGMNYLRLRLMEKPKDA